MRIPSALLLIGLAVPAFAQTQRVGIEVTADRSEVRPDGRSRVTITARVQAGSNPVPDGTVIRFATTAGRLDTDRATTAGGVARVTLTAADQPGIARITANLESGGIAVPAEVTVVFSADADQASGIGARKPWIRIKAADFISYAIHVNGTRTRLVGASSKAGQSILTAGDLTIGADSLQYDPDRAVVRASGNVIVFRGRESRSYQKLAWDLGGGKGIGETVDGRVVQFEGRDLLERDAVSPDPRVFEIVDQGIAESTVQCRQIEIEQGGQARLLMRDATLYVAGNRVASLPYHTMTGAQRTLFKEQLVGVGPAGVTLDLPLHFNVQPSGVGTLHLRRGAQFGSSIYASRNGWTLDLDQTYEGTGSRGLLQMLNMAKPNRGLRWQHAHQWGAFTDANVFVDSPNSRDLFSTVQLGHSFPWFRVGGFLSGTRTRAIDPVTGTPTATSGDTRSQFLLETYPRPLPGLPWLRFTVNANTQELRFKGMDAGDPLRSRSLGSRLITRPFPVAEGLTATQSVVLGRTWTSDTDAGALSVQGTTALTKAIGGYGNVQVNYDYIQVPNLVTFSTTGNPRHRVGISTDLTSPSGWNLNVYGARALDMRQSSISAGVGAPIGGGWEARTRVSDTALPGTVFREVEYSLVRVFDGRAVGVYYSTISRRIQLDLTGGLRF